MRTRILTAVIAFLVFLPFLIFADTPALPVAMAICGLVSTFEMIRCVGLHKNLALSLPLYLAAVAAPFALETLGPVYTGKKTDIIKKQYLLFKTDLQKCNSLVNELDRLKASKKTEFKITVDPYDFY